MSTFADLGLAPPLIAALADAGYTTPTPIQAACVPLLLAGRDLCGTAQTGTGKTAAFALPILHAIANTPRAGDPGAERARSNTAIRALILAPTRELAVQIDDAFGTYGKHIPGFRHAVVYGGVKTRAQRNTLADGIDVLVATPGRLLDLVGQRAVQLGRVEWLVLDEADRMLDIGFLADVRKVVELLPERRQTVLFSATLPRAIEKLASQIMQDPASVSVAAPSAAADRVRQFVRFVEPGSKREALLAILADPAATRVLVFVRARDRAEKLTAMLRNEKIAADGLHADRPQRDRLAALAAFARGDVRVLVASELAARGIDVDGITHVVNFDVPSVPESYVHRIGRTARAGAEGVAIALCSKAERLWLAEIERVTRQKMEVVEG